MTKINVDSNLDDIYSNIWRCISGGIKNRHSDFHTFSLATSTNNIVNNRTVVLRGCDPEKGKIVFHTHLSSLKIEEIRDNDNVECLFYSRKNKIQIRLKGKAAIHNNDELCNNKWNKMSRQSQLCYFQNIEPGNKIDDPKKIHQVHGNHISEHFTIVEVTITKTEWLYLSHDGHRRAEFKHNNVITGQWLAP